MFLEHYMPLLERDIEQATTSLSQPMPDPVRTALEGELERLHRMREVLTSEQKSVLHALRGRLRWSRKRLADAADSGKKKEIEREIRNIEAEIARHVQREQREESAAR